MDKFFEVVKARVKTGAEDRKLTETLMKTLENIAYERAGKLPPYNDAEIFEELMSLKEERRETIHALSDDAALIATELFEKWNPQKEYSEGDRFLYNGNLYRCKKKNPVNPTWTPDVVYDYYEPVAKPTENGSFERPITAVAGMEYEIGKYYSDNGKVYICERQGSNAGDKITLHYLPSALIGLYFREVTE